MIDAARKLAVRGHQSQQDKGGAPYIGHPARVAMRVEPYGPAYVAVAWMHDLLEDTPVTVEQLHELGFPNEVVAGVVAMTKVSDDREASIARACADPIALVVKAADVADNTDPERLALLADAQKRAELVAKYRQYRKVLDEHGAPTFATTVPTPAL